MIDEGEKSRNSNEEPLSISVEAVLDFLRLQITAQELDNVRKLAIPSRLLQSNEPDDLLRIALRIFEDVCGYPFSSLNNGALLKVAVLKQLPLVFPANVEPQRILSIFERVGKVIAKNGIAKEPQSA